MSVLAMPLLRAAPVPVTDRERQQLGALVRQQTCPQQLAVRARIILLAGRGAGVRPTADELDIGRSTVPPGVRIEVASPWEGLCEDGASPSWGLMGAGAAGKESVGQLDV